MSALSDDASDLLARARHVEHAVDLYLAPGAQRVTADRLVELLHRAPLDAVDDRALWNLLFAAGELSLSVDVYRAFDLFRAAVALVERIAATRPLPGDPRAIAAEMSFDFFFARASHPLVPLRSREVLGVLGQLLAHDGRVARRAAIHGLGHVIALGRDRAWSTEAVALLDEALGGRLGAPLDAELTRYAEDSRHGALP